MCMFYFTYLRLYYLIAHFKNIEMFLKYHHPQPSTPMKSNLCSNVAMPVFCDLPLIAVASYLCYLGENFDTAIYCVSESSYLF